MSIDALSPVFAAARVWRRVSRCSFYHIGKDGVLSIPHRTILSIA